MMSDDTTNKTQQEDTLVPDAEEIMGAAEAQVAPDEMSGRELDDLRREAEELRQQMLRALAEAENVRRRAQRDVSDARQYAVTSFARDLLNVADNFARAVASVQHVEAQSLPPELKALLDGVQMTDRELKSVFERHGIKPIDAVGQKFDPNLHQAMYEIENTEVASGTVVQVVQLGSMIGDRVLRPAMVGVSKGGPKPGEPKPAAAAAEPGDDGPDGGEASQPGDAD